MESDPVLGDASDRLKDYYEDRFAGGYMSFWSPLQRSRLRDVVSSLPIARSGNALDFGCGQGVMTREVKDALPAEWHVFGTDLSALAIQQAATRNRDITFESSESLLQRQMQFDLVLTHHVLEHVGDVAETIAQIDQFVRPGGLIVHALPCGNSGSLEWKLCQRVENGIEKERGNRFFFEEEGHLRRLESREVIELENAHDAHLVQEFFAGHKWVGIEWISASHPRLIHELTPVHRGVSTKARVHIAGAKVGLLALNMARMPSVLARRSQGATDLSRFGRTASRLSRALLPISRPFDSWITNLAETEWSATRSVGSGSEMYLVFRKANKVEKH